jgi:hypothetical protein
LKIAKKKLLKLFFSMPHLIPIQTARAIAKLEENWSLAAVARKLHCSKTSSSLHLQYKKMLARKQA